MNVAAEHLFILRQVRGRVSGLEIPGLATKDGKANRAARFDVHLAGIGHEGHPRPLIEELASDGEADTRYGAGGHVQGAGVKIGGRMVKAEIAFEAKVGVKTCPAVESA